LSAAAEEVTEIWLKKMMTKGQAMRLDPRLKLFRKQEQDEKDRLKNEK
jgi:hypothetical protein